MESNIGVRSDVLRCAQVCLETLSQKDPATKQLFEKDFKILTESVELFDLVSTEMNASLQTDALDKLENALALGSMFKFRFACVR